MYRYVLLLLLVQFTVAATENDSEPLLDWAIKHQIKTLPDFIGKLNSEQRRRRTFLDSSEGDLSASPAHPKAIVFGDDAEITLTYNEVEQKVNIIRANRDHSLSFRSLSFEPKEGMSVPYLVPSSENSCFECHRGTYIWEDYSGWKHSVAQDDTILKDSPVHARHKTFMKSAETNPYFNPLFTEEELKSGLTPPYRMVTEKDHYDDTKKMLVTQPNMHFTLLASRRNAQRIFSELKKSESEFARLKFLYLMAAANCFQDSPEMVDPRLLKAFVSLCKERLGSSTKCQFEEAIPETSWSPKTILYFAAKMMKVDPNGYSLEDRRLREPPYWYPNKLFYYTPGMGPDTIELLANKFVGELPEEEKTKPEWNFTRSIKGLRNNYHASHFEGVNIEAIDTLGIGLDVSKFGEAEKQNGHARCTALQKLALAAFDISVTDDIQNQKIQGTSIQNNLSPTNSTHEKK